MDRKIIRSLTAWDRDFRDTSVLPRGTLVSACRILRDTTAGGEPYVMEFLCAGRRFSSPLFKFQPRTQTLSAVVETVNDEKPVAAQWGA